MKIKNRLHRVRLVAGDPGHASTWTWATSSPEGSKSTPKAPEGDNNSKSHVHAEKNRHSENMPMGERISPMPDALAVYPDFSQALTGVQSGLASMPDRWQSLSRISRVQKGVQRCKSVRMGSQITHRRPGFGGAKSSGDSWADGLQCDPEPGLVVRRGK